MSLSDSDSGVSGGTIDGSIGEVHAIETHLIHLILQVPLGKRDHIIIFGICSLQSIGVFKAWK